MIRSTRRWLVRIVIALAALDAIYLWWLWPDWRELAVGAIPKSSFIEDYEAARARDPSLPALQWTPIPAAKIPSVVERAFVLAEDSRFYNHGGIDWAAVIDAGERNLERGEIGKGGSTISQQTAKNLFLSRQRTWLRKWHELVLTLALEANLTKRRIATIYLNVVELGEGVFGVEAAARHYYSRSVGSLSARQAAELAATLPSPLAHNPKSRTRPFVERHERILRWMVRFSPELVATDPTVTGAPTAADKPGHGASAPDAPTSQ